ncbi:hypothetical protein ACP7QD_003348 [Enterobacter bugandensis]
MSTITRERLRERAREKVKSLEFSITQTAFADSRAELEEELELARIALASLEADGLTDDVSDAELNAALLLHRLKVDGHSQLSDAFRAGFKYARRTAPQAPASDYPETLPCPVMLEPGLRFGKGVKTQTVLGALKRRAEYCAKLEAMTPGQRAGHDAGMKEFAAILQGAEKTEPLHAVKASPLLNSSVKGIELQHADFQAKAAGNSPMIPDGWVMVPVEPTPEMREAYHQAQGEYEDVDGLWSPDHQWQAMLAAAPKQEVKP